ncbi:MAG TPA: hypothetical protein VFF06_14020 [Polyangia bacterium]|nr:hypothetical protein [Polyangia bacterium]
MRPLSPKTRALIERLGRPRPLRTWLFGVDDREQLIEAIGASGEVAAIVHLITFLMADQLLANAASRAIACILRNQPIRVLAQLEQLRRFGGEWSHPQWHSLTPGGTRRLARLADGWAALGMASFHSSGFVREAAVRELDTLDGSEKRELLFLVLRLNDWVAQVRKAALSAMEKRLLVRYADALSCCR